MTTLRFGVLGTSKIGRRVIPAIQRADGCEVVAIASRDADVASTAAAELGIAAAHGSYEAVLEDPDVDAVYVPLPNHMHGAWAIAAAAAGKHVLCEKPLALDAAEAREMVDACAAAGITLMEAFMYRAHPSWIAAKRMVDEGAIGDLVAVQCWFSFFNDNPSNIRNVVAFGGGALMDVGCYCIDVARWLSGAEPTVTHAVAAREVPGGVDTTTSALLRLGDVHATFTCSTRAEPDQRVHISGTDGRIELEIPFNIPPDRLTRIFVTTGRRPAWDPDRRSVTFAAMDPYTAQAEAFAAAVLKGADLPVPPEGSVANMAALDAVRLATA